MAKTRKLSLARQFRAMDSKQRDFLESLDEEERKEYSSFLAIKYAANVEGIPELEEYQIMATNERANPHYLALSRHPKLQWLLLTSISPGMGNHNHYWLRANAKRGSNRLRNFVEKLYPHLSEDEVDLMISINTVEDFRTLARDLGWDDRRIRDEL